MRKSSLGLVLALFLVMTPVFGTVDMEPELEANGLGEHPEAEIGPSAKTNGLKPLPAEKGPSYESGGLEAPPQNQMGPSFDPNG